MLGPVRLCLSPHHVERKRRMRVSRTSTHLGRDPDGFHDLVLRRSSLQSFLCVTAYAIGTLRHVRDRYGDQLLRLRRQRTIGESAGAESLERGERPGCKFPTPGRDFAAHLRINWDRCRRRAVWQSGIGPAAALPPHCVPAAYVRQGQSGLRIRDSRGTSSDITGTRAAPLACCGAG